MGRPKLDIDPKLVLRALRIGCTTPEIAALCDCSEDTIERRFAGVLKRGRLLFCASIRRQQYRMLKKGDRTMGVWMGKQYLGQADKQEIETTGKSEIKVVVEHDRNFYGNANRLPTGGNGAPITDLTESGEAQAGRLGSPGGENGNGSNSNGTGPRT